MPDETQVIEGYRNVDACAVSDAMDRLGIPDRIVIGLTQFGSMGSVTGRAVTVLLGVPAGPPSHRHLCAAAVDASGGDDVLVVAHQGRNDCAGWGGNLSRAAQQRRIAATVVDGAVRDIDETSAIGYRVFARASTPRTARGRTEEKSWNEAVEFGGVLVEPGDVVVADSTGIAFVPRARAAEVLDVARSIVETEAAMANRIDDGMPISEVMGINYETMLTTGDPT